MIIRSRELHRLRGLVRTAPVVAILGPRQVGKATLAQLFSSQYRGPTRWFDLEDPDDLARLAEPKLALSEHQGLIVIDEVQRRLELFPILRVLADRPGNKVRFLLLGSASPDLLRQSSESLAGRIHYHELRGFSVSEVGDAAAGRLWVRGGFPRCSSRAPLLSRSPGGAISSEPFSSATWQTSDSGCPLQRCSGFGGCSATITASSGTPPNSPEPLGSPPRPSGTISIS